MRPTRRQMVQMLGALGVVHSPVEIAATPEQLTRSARDLNSCLTIQGRDLDQSRIQVVSQSLERNRQQFQAVRDLAIGDAVPPALTFRPWHR